MLPLPSVRSPLLIAMVLGAVAAPPETHPFDLTRDQHQSLRFPVDSPGRIDARVEWRGSPLIVSLVGPAGQVARQTASGRVELTYEVTAADVQRGDAWLLTLQSAERGGDPLAVVAKGTISLEHPAGDVAKMTARVDAERKQQLAQYLSRSAQLGRQLLQARQARVAQYQQAEDDATHRAQAQLLQHVVALRTHAVARPATVVGRVPIGGSNARPAPAPSSAGAVSTPVTSPTPVITALSNNQGQPGDALLISGSGFGQSAAAAGATVHLVVAPGKDVQLDADYWSDTQIQTSIPDGITGVPENPQAAIYIEVASGSSPLVPFHFKPAIEIAFTTVSSSHAHVDYATGNGEDQAYGPTPPVGNQPPAYPDGYVLHEGGLIMGGSGNDIWNAGRRLKNGWTVVSVDEGLSWRTGDADAIVSQYHAGSSDLSFTIHWSDGSGDVVLYAPTMFIHGPRGVPWQ